MHAMLRDREEAMLRRCAAAARTTGGAPADAMEANVFRVAAMVMQSRHPTEATRLRGLADRYFASHPKDLMPVARVVDRASMVSLPRLRDMLSHYLSRT